MNDAGMAPKYKINVTNPKTGKVQTWFTSKEDQNAAVERVIDRMEEITPIKDLPDYKADWQVEVIPCQGQ